MASVVTIPKAIVQAYRDARGGQATAVSAAVSKSGAPVPSSNPAATLESVGVLEWRGPAGTLQLGAAPDSPPQVAVYQTTFYPAASDPATGLSLDVEPGVVRTNIDLNYRLSHSFQIAGTLRAPGGEAVAHAGLRLVSSGMDALASDRGFETAISATDENGHFLMLGVPPGRYVLQATIGTNSGPPVNSPEALLTMTIDSAGRLSAPLRPASDELFWARETLDVGDADVRELYFNFTLASASAAESNSTARRRARQQARQFRCYWNSLTRPAKVPLHRSVLMRTGVSKPLRILQGATESLLA